MEGYRFTGWSGASTSTVSPVTITMDSDLTLTANFIRVLTLQINISPVGGGTVVRSPNQETYDVDTEVTLTAIPEEGYEFITWLGLTQDNPAMFAGHYWTLPQDVNIPITFTARFKRIDNDRFGTLAYGSQDYRTIEIGSLTWMAENLNLMTDNSWCYDDDISYCETYGRLYTWDAAMSACPPEWRLPRENDWNDLHRAVGSHTHLMSNNGWIDGGGIDAFDFSALPGGQRHDDGNFADGGTQSYWWGVEEAEFADGQAYCHWIRPDGTGHGFCHKSQGLSVRCIQNVSQ
jgi:uncharacterized protein (TIGR02145 family)/uncharacterized repeat protein (TIGR02543 family)